MIARSFVLVSALLFLGIAPLSSAPAPAANREFRVDAIPQATHSGPTVAVFPDGGFVVVWTVGPPSGQGRTVIHARFFKKNGSPATGEFRLIDRGVGSQVADQVVADPDGSFLLAWTETFLGNSGNVFVQRFNRDGTPRGGRIQLNAPGEFGSGAVLTIGPGRRFAAAWESYIEVPSFLNYTDAVARIFTPEGVQLSDEIVIGYGDGGIGDDTIHAFPGGVALGRDGSLTVLFEYYENGTRTAWMTRVPPRSDSRTLIPVFQSYSPGFGTALARRQDGSLIAVWSEYEALLARRYTASGAPRGPAFVASKEGVAPQVLPAVAALSSGGYVIVWNEEDRDGDGYGVFGRVFGADGTPLSGDLQLNTTTAGHQFGAAIATSPGGPVVAVWQGDGIFARILPVTNP